jgi:hypothetical protein
MPEKQIEIYRRPAGEDYAERLTCGPRRHRDERSHSGF